MPSNHRRPVTSYPALQVFFFGPKAYASGLAVLDVRGRALTIYSPENTLTDLLRYAPKYGRELYLEGLKKYLARPSTRLQVLIEMGQSQGVWRELSRDLEVLAHDVS